MSKFTVTILEQNCITDDVGLDYLLKFIERTETDLVKPI